MNDNTSEGPAFASQRQDSQRRRMEKAKEELICSICTEFFSRPRSLACLHSFCESCLILLATVPHSRVDPSALTCPECRALSNIPQEGIEGFPLNCKLGRLVEILSPAERNEIKRVRQESRAASHPELTCHAHSGKPMDFYCENCKMLVCFQCTMSEHRQHEAVCYAKEALPHHIEVLSSCLSTAKSAASQANTTSMQLREKTKEVQRQSGQKAGAIQDFFLRARQLLSEREQELVGVVRREQQEKEDWLARRQQDVQRNLEDIRKDVKALQDIEAHRREDVRVLLEEADIKAQIMAHVDLAEQHSSIVECRDKTNVTPFVGDVTFEDKCRSVGSGMPIRSSSTVSASARSPGTVSAGARSPATMPAGARSPGSVPVGARSPSTMSPSQRQLISRSSYGSGLVSHTHKMSSHSESEGCDSDLEDSYEDRPSLLKASSITSLPPTPPPAVRHFSIDYQPEIIEPILEIGPRSIGGAFFRTVTKEVLPCGVCSGKNNTIVVADIRSSCFTVLTNTGKCLEVIGTEGKGDGQFVEPTAVCMDSEGCIIVADKALRRVQKFAPSGKFISKFSVRSIRGQHLGEPWGIAISFEDKILVTDRDKSCIHSFDMSGRYQGNFTPIGESLFKYPTGITVDKRGRIIITDRGSHCVWIVTPEGQLLQEFGHQGQAPGELYYPFGVAVAKDGNIYVAESGNHRISVFSPLGTFLHCFGCKGSEPGMFCYPRHICFDSQDRLVVSDEHNHRLQVFSV